MRILLIILAAAVHAGYAAADGIVAGSSHIMDIVNDLAGNAQDHSLVVQTLIPPTLCPGHFDAKPSDLTAIKSARAVIIHDWQASSPNIQALLKAAEAPSDRVFQVAAAGNLLAPPTQIQAIQSVAEAMAKIDPARAASVKELAAQRVAAVNRTAEEVQAQLKEAGCVGMNVICHDKLTPLLNWAGFNVVGEYGRDGDLSASAMLKLIENARRQSIALVVDNLQGGAMHTAATIARDTRAAHVIVSNFPGGFPGVDTWDQTLRKDVQLLTQAAAQIKK